MQEARCCLLAQPEHFRVPRAQLPHLCLRDVSVVQRFAPVRAALEHGQVLCGLGDLRDRLHTRRARPDHSDPLALECHLVLRPEPGVIGLASRSEEHTSELQSLMRISYAVFCLKKKNNTKLDLNPTYTN